MTEAGDKIAAANAKLARVQSATDAATSEAVAAIEAERGKRAVVVPSQSDTTARSPQPDDTAA